jgi:hypothetical protein
MTDFLLGRITFVSHYLFSKLFFTNDDLKKLLSAFPSTQLHNNVKNLKNVCRFDTNCSQTYITVCASHSFFCDSSQTKSRVSNMSNSLQLVTSIQNPMAKNVEKSER